MQTKKIIPFLVAFLVITLSISPFIHLAKAQGDINYGLMPNYWQMNITKKHEKTIKIWEKEVQKEMGKARAEFEGKKDNGKIGIELIYYK